MLFVQYDLVISRRNGFQGTGSKVPEPVPKPRETGTVLANVNTLRSLYAIVIRSVCLSSVCDVGAPYSAG